MNIGLPDGYTARPEQNKFIKEAHNTVSEGNIFMASAPCGIGKSLASLKATLPLLNKERKLVIVYRTRGQLEIYLKELRALKTDRSVLSLISKQKMCPLDLLKDLKYHEFLEECNNLKKNGGCPFYTKTVKDKTLSNEAKNFAFSCMSQLVNPQIASKIGKRKGFCAYEALRRLLPSVDIFLGTYHYMFNPKTNEGFLRSFKTDLSNIILIVDEAHNLPEFTKDQLSDTLTLRSVKIAKSEALSFSNKVRVSTIEVNQVVETLKILIKKISSYNNLKNEAVLKVEQDEIIKPLSDIETRFNSELMCLYGKEIKKYRRKIRKRAYSYVLRVGEFLGDLATKTGEKYLHSVSKDYKGRLKVNINCFDGREISSKVLSKVYSGILMSGALTPIDVYKDLIFFPNDRKVIGREFSSPFPRENRIILAGLDVSSKMSDRNDAEFTKWKNYLERILSINKGNVAVFFTNYSLLNKITPMIETSRNKIIEKRERSEKVINELTKSNNSALFGVIRGKFSEGIDYPNNILTCVVSMGFPYAQWNDYCKEYIKYLNQKFPGKGRLYGYTVPALLALIQTCGRVHRSPDDKGCIIILDKRMTYSKIRKHLPKYFREEMMFVNGDTCEKKIKEFWESQNVNIVFEGGKNGTKSPDLSEFVPT